MIKRNWQKLGIYISDNNNNHPTIRIIYCRIFT